MAGETANEIIQGDLTANADLSGSQNLLVKLDVTTDRAVILAAANSDQVHGVLLNKPTSGQAAAIQIFGEAKVIYGGTVTRGDALMSNGSGQAVTKTSTNPVFAYALESGVSGEKHSVRLV